ncbi:MAG TPA: FHA domain-containing protein, partial [Planctomycetota bacterium]|nr:FHA domain-containing protein [Planctomycetota bacterium]
MSRRGAELALEGPLRVRIEESGRSRIVELTGERVVAGRGSACTLVLEDAAASREHFALELRGGSWWLRDLESRNGTTVNGRAVPGSALRPGDRIGVGSATVVLLGDPSGVSVEPVADLAVLARDAETGLWTAAWLGRELDRAVASGRTRAVLVKLDMDSLGLLNDMVGWKKGDEAIVGIAREVRATFEDAFGERCVVAREAGGKLSVLVLDEAPERALEVTELARERASSIAFDDVLVETAITLSAGLASAPDDAPLGRELVRRAEAALAEAKRRGRDRTVRAE